MYWNLLKSVCKYGIVQSQAGKFWKSNLCWKKGFGLAKRPHKSSLYLWQVFTTYGGIFQIKVYCRWPLPIYCQSETLSETLFVLCLPMRMTFFLFLYCLITRAAMPSIFLKFLLTLKVYLTKYFCPFLSNVLNLFWLILGVNVPIRHSDTLLRSFSEINFRSDITVVYLQRSVCLTGNKWVNECLIVDFPGYPFWSFRLLASIGYNWFLLT